MSKYETGGRPQIMIKKDTLKRSTAIGLKNTDVDKMFNVGRILVSRCVKVHGLTNFLREHEDDNEITLLHKHCVKCINSTQI